MAKKKIFFGWYIAGLGMLNLLFAYGIRNSFTVYFPFILDDFQMSRALTSGVVSLSLLVNLFFTPIAGYAIDKYGPKWLIVGGALFCGISLLCMPLITSLWHLYLLYGLTFAIGVNLMGLTVSNSMSVNWFVKYRATAIAITSAGAAMGAAIFNPLSEKLIFLYGWEMSFAFIGAALLVIVIPSALIFAEKRPEDMGLYTDGDEPGETSAAANYLSDFKEPDIIFTVKEFFRIVNFWLIGFAWMLMATAAGLLIHVVAYCMEKGIGSSDAAWALGYMALVRIAARFEWAPINYWKKNNKVSCAAGMIFYAAGWLALTFVSAPIHFYIAVTIFGFGSAGVDMLPALVGEQFGRESMGKVYGFINVFGAAGGAIGPILAGWIFDAVGSYVLAWQAGGAMSVVGAVFFFSVAKSPYEERKAALASVRKD